jgi:hypothetical protein
LVTVVTIGDGDTSSTTVVGRIVGSALIVVVIGVRGMATSVPNNHEDQDG